MLLRHRTTMLALLAAGTCAAADAPGVLLLCDAVAATPQTSPELEAAGYTVDARTARARQADLLPNPELRLEAENIGGSGDFAGGRGPRLNEVRRVDSADQVAA